MSEDTLTHKDLANLLGVSETTIKSYRRKFPGCITVASKGKPIRFKSEAKEVALRIRDLFGTGMSVEEVKDRLSKDFSWYKPKSPLIVKPKEDFQENLPQNFATALSNMAKSMISLNQQQAAIAANMQRIEVMLKEIGLGGDDAGWTVLKEAQAKRDAEAKASVHEMSALTMQVKDVLAAVAAALEENRQLNCALAEERNSIIQSVERMVNASISTNLPPLDIPERSRVVSLQQRPEPSRPIAAQQPEISEIPRHLLSLPLVVRAGDGSYMSAGGKVLGRISINDLKAMLAHEYLPPNHYTLRWEKRQEGWWAILEQPDRPVQAEASIQLQVSEIISTRGVSVLEVSAYMYNGLPAHPAEFYSFVTSIGKN